MCGVNTSHPDAGRVTFRVTFCVDHGTLRILDQYVAGHFDMSRSDAIRQAIRLMLKVESGREPIRS